MDSLKQLIRNVPDFPQPGIGFKDITTLIKDGAAFRQAVDALAEHYNPDEVDLIVGVEARGFIFASALATDAVEIHKDAIQPQQRILLVDDLLATGGTVAAAAKLVEQLQGNIIGIAFLIELTFLRIE